MMTHDEMIAVIQAHKDGKAIQQNCLGTWMDVTNPSWDFHVFDYRIKREPRIAREVWLNQYGGQFYGSQVHPTKRLAELNAIAPRTTQVRFIEVIEEVEGE